MNAVLMNSKYWMCDCVLVSKMVGIPCANRSKFCWNGCQQYPNICRGTKILMVTGRYSVAHSKASSSGQSLLTTSGTIAVNDMFFDEGNNSKPVAEAIHWYCLVFEGQGQMTRSMCCWI
jgi:hypothetical protein